MVNGEIDWGAVRREQAEAWRREREKHGLDRAEVDEILVSGTAPIWVERGGRLAKTDTSFESDDQLRLTI